MAADCGEGGGGNAVEAVEREGVGGWCKTELAEGR